MGYLLPAEYVEYGLPADTTDDWITTASSLIESYCRRASLNPTQYSERQRLSGGIASDGAQLYAADHRRTQCQRTGRCAGSLWSSSPWRASRSDAGADRLGFQRSGQLERARPHHCRLSIEDTGELIFPRNFLGIGYNEVKVTYTAGVDTIPPGQSKSPARRS